MAIIAPLGESVAADAVALVRQEKTLRGAFYGSSTPAWDFGRMIDMYNAGQLDIDGLITRTYTLDRINEAYEELERGVVGRGIITFE